jgi:hypothetical protein
LAIFSTWSVALPDGALEVIGDQIKRIAAKGQSTSMATTTTIIARRGICVPLDQGRR